MDRRFEAFSKRMEEAGVEAALITSPENMRYLSGFTGEGALLAAAGKATIFTDFRYTEQAARQSPGCTCVRTTREHPMPEMLRGELAQTGVGSLAIEPESVTVAQMKRLTQALGPVALMDLQDFAGELRAVKDDYEISCIVRASEIACRAFEEMLGMIKPGMTEKDVQLELDYRMLRGGSEAVAFETIACAGVNGSLPHAVPSDHRLCEGELLTMDFGAQVNGYKTDMTRTIAIGRVSDALRDIYDTVLAAQLAALAIIEPGLVCEEADRVARDVIERKYPGTFGHTLGHGVGLRVHEGPNLRAGCKTVLQPGHVVTVEPGVYIEGVGGCRIEDTVIIRPGGYVNVITAPKELISL